MAVATGAGSMVGAELTLWIHPATQRILKWLSQYRVLSSNADLLQTGDPKISAAYTRQFVAPHVLRLCAQHNYWINLDNLYSSCQAVGIVTPAQRRGHIVLSEGHSPHQGGYT